eukprot:CAMPEP_0180229474 /NCGR_PEP_ID=MMETSP0987-20121128/25533_1 /TAXON_ID=697907 /ORGANISM="non described non described, Strain CCMP2293" /LENGTH=129 /DNA_ID=CAMNT_0022194171 /DNA_START=368 /DNA_END=754 /DNA_ORIENTATION=-
MQEAAPVAGVVTTPMHQRARAALPPPSADDPSGVEVACKPFRDPNVQPTNARLGTCRRSTTRTGAAGRRRPSELAPASSSPPSPGSCHGGRAASGSGRPSRPAGYASPPNPRRPRSQSAPDEHAAPPPP